MKKLLPSLAFLLPLLCFAQSQGEFPWQLSGGRGRMMSPPIKPSIATPPTKVQSSPKRHIIVQSITLPIPNTKHDSNLFVPTKLRIERKES